jgi:hypothetical protein
VKCDYLGYFFGYIKLKNALYRVNRDESNAKKLHRPISSINLNNCKFMFYKNGGGAVLFFH